MFSTIIILSLGYICFQKVDLFQLPTTHSFIVYKSLNIKLLKTIQTHSIIHMLVFNFFCNAILTSKSTLYVKLWIKYFIPVRLKVINYFTYQWKEFLAAANTSSAEPMTYNVFFTESISRLIFGPLGLTFPGLVISTCWPSTTAISPSAVAISFKLHKKLCQTKGKKPNIILKLLNIYICLF